MTWTDWLKNETHWLYDDLADEVSICGNRTGTGRCPEGYTCVQVID